MDAKHPAENFLLANLSFNLTELKDLEYICELAELSLDDSELKWLGLVRHYRQVLKNRITELEAQLEAYLKG